MKKSENGKSADEILPGAVGATHRSARGADRSLTINQGVAVADNQNALKSEERDPLLLGDFNFREKITDFDHERIPKRDMPARYSGAHGYLEVTRAWDHQARFSSAEK
jgi:catalase